MAIRSEHRTVVLPAVAGVALTIAASAFGVVASAQARADRRFREMQSRGMEADLSALLAEIEARDARDMGRANAPLVQAEDAALLDTKIGRAHV